MDVVKVIRQVLLADAGVSALVGTNVFGGVLPEHYDPSTVVGTSGTANGPAIVLTVRGGSVDPEVPLQRPSLQVQCWAGVNDFVRARKLYNSVFAVLHGLENFDGGVDGRILSCVAEMLGSDLVDSEAGWVQVVSAYKIMMV